MPLIQNKKAYFNYEILEKIEAGIELLGFEVKSLKKGQGTLEGSHITIRGNEAFVINMQIPPYQPANTPKDYDPTRNRRLLVTKKEIERLLDIAIERTPANIQKAKWKKIKSAIRLGSFIFRKQLKRLVGLVASMDIGQMKLDEGDKYACLIRTYYLFNGKSFKYIDFNRKSVDTLSIWKDSLEIAEY